MTHTYVELEISPAAFCEIREKLEAAGYEHAFMDDATIDMHGIAVTLGPPTGLMGEWIAVADRAPDGKEPVVYARRKPGRKRWFVGIAYWTVSDKWNPEMESTKAPDGYTHWMPLPETPNVR